MEEWGFKFVFIVLSCDERGLNIEGNSNFNNIINHVISSFSTPTSSAFPTSPVIDPVFS